jgi:hypothetical protein
MATVSKATVSISIGPNEYQIKYPNVGEQMNIEILKLQLTENKYDTLRFSYNSAFIKQADVADAIATFNTLIPDLRKDLNAKSMLELEQSQINEVVKAYTEVFLPWYEEWNAKYANPNAEEKTETNV